MGKKTKKEAGADSKKEEKKEQDPFLAGISQLPKEAQEKLKAIKAKLDTFKEKVLSKFDKYVAGIALLPPKRKLQDRPAQQAHEAIQENQKATLVPEKVEVQGEKKEEPEISVLVLVDDSDSSKMPKYELKDKLSKIIQTMATEVDKEIKVEVIILSELWQSCFDGKYDLLQLIAVSAAVYDKGMLSAIKIAEVHKNMVLRKFEKYIVSYVLAGSLVQGRATKESDIDVWIVIDDTDVKKMTRIELKDKLRAIIIGMGIEAGELTGIKNKINIQVYILTEFWDSLKEANPIIFTLLRDGVPFYDRGIFMPWKQLLRMGRIKPSWEAIDMFMKSGDQMVSRVKYKLKEIGMEDVFYALLTPSQAAIMMMGIAPPAPKETPDLMRELFVKKKAMIEEKYIKILEDVIKLRKDLEHGTKKEVEGKEIDGLIRDADSFLKRIKKLFGQIDEMREAESMVHLSDSILGTTRDALRLEGVEGVADKDLVAAFEDKFAIQGRIPARHLRMLKDLLKAKKDYDAKKLTKQEVEKLKKDSGGFIRYMVEHMQRRRGREIERAKVRVKYGEKFADVILLGEQAFIIHDIDAEQKQISKAKIKEDGSLGALATSNLEEFEKDLAKVTIPPKVFIKEPIFENLKNIFGHDIEILVNY